MHNLCHNCHCHMYTQTASLSDLITVARGRIGVWDTGGGRGSWLGEVLVGEGVVDKVMMMIIIIIITKLMMMIQIHVQVYLGLAEGKITSGSVERVGPSEYTVIVIIVIVVIF